MTINARTLTPEQYAALKRDVLADAAKTTRNAAPLDSAPPATVEGMTDAQYTAHKQAFIRGAL